MPFTPSAISHRAGSHVLSRWTLLHAITAADLTLKRLAELGLALPPDNRLARAQRYVSRTIATASRDGSAKIDAARFSESVRTMMEQFFIVRGVGEAPHPLVRDRLTYLLQGADTPTADAKSLARDTEFELAMIALLQLGGVQGVHLGEPDIRIPAGDELMGIAVKRLSSAKQLTKRVYEAVRQLRRQELRGMIVLNLDALVTGLNPADSHRRSAELVRECRELLGQFNALDIVAGVLGTVGTVHWGDPALGPLLQLYVSHHLQLVAPPEEHDSINGIVATIGQNISRALERQTDWLELHLKSAPQRRP